MCRIELDAKMLYSIIKDYKVSREFASVMWFRSKTAENIAETDSLEDIFLRFKQEVSIKQNGYTLPNDFGNADDCCTIVASIINQIAQEKEITKSQASYLMRDCHTIQLLNSDNVLKGFKRDRYKNVVEFFTTDYVPWEYNYLAEAGYDQG